MAKKPLPKEPEKRAAAHLGKGKKLAEVSGSVLICKLLADEHKAIGSYELAAEAFRKAGDSDTAALIDHIREEEEEHAEELTERKDSAVDVEDVLGEESEPA